MISRARPDLHCHLHAPELFELPQLLNSFNRRGRWERLSLLGWATGGQWAGYYAALHSDKLSHLVIHNALYGANTPQPLVGRTWKTTIPGGRN